MLAHGRCLHSRAGQRCGRRGGAEGAGCGGGRGRWHRAAGRWVHAGVGPLHAAAPCVLPHHKDWEEVEQRAEMAEANSRVAYERDAASPQCRYRHKGLSETPACGTHRPWPEPGGRPAPDASFVPCAEPALPGNSAIGGVERVWGQAGAGGALQRLPEPPPLTHFPVPRCGHRPASRASAWLAAGGSETAAYHSRARAEWGVVSQHSLQLLKSVADIGATSARAAPYAGRP